MQWLTVLRDGQGGGSVSTVEALGIGANNSLGGYNGPHGVVGVESMAHGGAERGFEDPR